MVHSGTPSRSSVSLVAAVGCFVLLATERGLGLSGGWQIAGFASLAAVQAVLLLLPDRAATLRARLRADIWTTSLLTVMAAMMAVAAAGGFPGGTGPDGRLLAAATRTLSALVAAGILLRRTGRMLWRLLPAWAILPATIASAILLGSVLLSLDWSVEPAGDAAGAGRDIGYLDALFTAASATCVTGLTVVDTGESFSTFGEAVILVLIQIGGLGLMSFAAFFALFLGQRVGLGESVSISKAMDAEFLSSLRSLIMSIMIWTFMIEASGALLLYTTWRSIPEVSCMGDLELAWQAVFHSVSAFCNAGFALRADNLERFAGSPATCFTVGSLIVLGGLGFSVLTALSAWSFARVRGERGRVPPLQARLAVRMTLALVAVSMALVAVAEWNRGTFEGMSGVQRAANSFLMAVTPRTAGFDTIPVPALSPVVQVAFVALMFIGASPGGTGGGVKTTTLGLLLHGGISILRHRPAPEIMHRRVPPLDLQRAAVLLAASLGLCAASAAALVAAEGGSISAGARGIFDYIFETVSAFGTVGLSLGVTPELTNAGRWIIIITMFAGRVGPATLAMVTARPRTLDYSYPEARVGIG